MYSLDINFLNDRVERAPEVGGRAPARVVQDSPRPLYIGTAIGVFGLAVVLGSWVILQQRNASLEARRAELDTQLTALQAQLQEVDSINAQVAAINAENKALATVFDRIKPWSAILQDVRDRVPTGVQVALIEQKDPTTQPGAAPPPPSPSPAAGDAAAPAAAPAEPPPSTIQISGQARNFSDVNDFLLTLQRSPFLETDKTRLVTAELIDNPTQVKFEENQRQTTSSNQVQVQLPKVVQFTIESTLTNLPASELLQDMERTLAVGLPARIQSLRDRGVIQP
ncbi:MAG TPA: PilN domain-containing protein [Crinalium sp.]|jgi:type IV pilus assembly protein PilN